MPTVGEPWSNFFFIVFMLACCLVIYDRMRTKSWPMKRSEQAQTFVARYPNIINVLILGFGGLLMYLGFYFAGLALILFLTIVVIGRWMQTHVRGYKKESAVSQIVLGSLVVLCIALFIYQYFALVK